MGGQLTRNALYDSLGGPFPSTSHRCHHKPKHCLPIQCGGGLAGAMVTSPLLFHPSAKGSQIVMDPGQRMVKRQASFCNAITFTNRPVSMYEQVRLKITKKQCCWSGALRLGFTSNDPSRINPENLPKYACPDLVSQSGFWAKALPEEFANEGSVVAFWVDKKGRVFYRLNDSSPMLFFSGVRTAQPLWALVDVYGLTRGLQLLDSEIVPPDCLRPHSFTNVRSASLVREPDDSRLSISLCDLNLRQEDGGGGGGGSGPGAHGRHSHRHTLHLTSASSSSSSSNSASCSIPQNSLNSQQSSLLPASLESDLHFHQLRGAHIKTLDKQTVSRGEHAREERTLVFTDRPLRTGETVFIKVTKSSPARAGSLSYGVTSCDPAVLRPSDLPYNPEALVDRKEFWAVCRVPTPLQSSDILGFLVTAEGEVILSHNGTNVGMQVCVDNSRPLWMFFGLHGAVTQLRILGSTHLGEPRPPSNPGSPPSSSPHTPSALGSGRSDPVLNGGLYSVGAGSIPDSPSKLSKSLSFPAAQGAWPDECSICYENAVDTVIYACGHMCLCYTCGLKLKKMSNACCPICRRQIKDIIKTYRST
ncbi:E3 ubiquitin-protein ligase NEURL1 isoform X1 [Gadus morhua]|uniref:E3 ubiquitin-protein ligase NEURL1 isoform X1 n=1 Tax=Gadus morhua TaxID=8049 RepID=UPI0011B814B8|nr:E3 ubiquitin-protein ligase NEURL1-like isoform X1 [Gadus morhua]